MGQEQADDSTGLVTKDHMDLYLSPSNGPKATQRPRPYLEF